MPNQNDPTQNPNPVNPPADQPVGQATTPPVPPIIFPQSDLPPLSPEFQSLPGTDTTGAPADQSPIQPVADDAGSSTPPDISSVIPKARKKFGGGKIIATILGLFLLLGGIGAGIFLVGQRQLFQQKAALNCPVINGCVADHEESECNDSGEMCTVYIGEPGYESNSTVCSVAGTQCGTSGYYCMISGGCHACIKYTTCYWKATNCVADESCGGSPSTPTPTPEPTPTHTATPTPTPTPTYGGCGAPCNDFDHCIPSLNCPGGPGGGRCVNGSCPEETDCVCGSPTPTPTGTLRACNASCQADEQCSTGYCTTGGKCRNYDCPNDTDCICTGTPTPTPQSTPTPTPQSTPTPTPNAMCSAVKAYDTNWNLLTGVQLSALGAGDVIRFTVSGIPADKIDKARFTINGVLGSEITTKKPGTDEYYVEYTIPTGVYSFTVTAQIHHTTIGWF